MKLKVGDRVTLTLNPTIELAKYVFVKPSASITFDTDAEGKELERAAEALRELLFRSIALELNVLNEVHEILGKGDIDALARYASEIANGRQPEKGHYVTSPAKTARSGGGEQAAARKAGQQPVRPARRQSVAPSQGAGTR